MRRADGLAAVLNEVRDLLGSAGLDVEARRIDVEVPEAELTARTHSAATVAGSANPRRGCERLYVDSVLQADTGADLNMLAGSSGSQVSRESH